VKTASPNTRQSDPVLEVEGLDAEELGGLAELFLDAEELVVLADAVGAGGRAGFDLAGSRVATAKSAMKAVFRSRRSGG